MVFAVKLVWWDYVLVVGYRMDAGVLLEGPNHVPSRCERADSATRQQRREGSRGRDEARVDYGAIPEYRRDSGRLKELILRRGSYEGRGRRTS